jgi:hypothetical protein
MPGRRFIPLPHRGRGQGEGVFPRPPALGMPRRRCQWPFNLKAFTCGQTPSPFPLPRWGRGMPGRLFLFLSPGGGEGCEVGCFCSSRLVGERDAGSFFIPLPHRGRGQGEGVFPRPPALGMSRRQCQWPFNLKAFTCGQTPSPSPLPRWGRGMPGRLFLFLFPGEGEGCEVGCFCSSFPVGERDARSVVSIPLPLRGRGMGRAIPLPPEQEGRGWRGMPLPKQYHPPQFCVKHRRCPKQKPQSIPPLPPHSPGRAMKH